VIPSERTRISLKIVDGSIRASTPGHPGAAIFFVGEMDFSTDIVGDSQENSFHVSVPALSLLFLDDLDADDVRAQSPKVSIIPQGISHWKVGRMINQRCFMLMACCR
jgi:autophagy-related protein 2